MPLPTGGALIDTPGMRELQLWAGSTVWIRHLAILPNSATGHFRDCAHSVENGCAVQAALGEGALILDDGRATELRAEVAFTSERPMSMPRRRRN
jgi:ribosome biogenesis GTPase